MAPGRFRFDSFSLDLSDRQLRRDDAPVELNTRYLDALALLVREEGRLVSKDRFLEEVWRGVPVTDEALTQCIRTLRRQLGDDAARPRFIETVPKHGYRFIAPVTLLDAETGHAPSRETASRAIWPQLVRLGGAATIGGGVAGFLGGLFYGFGGAAPPLQAGMGAVSVLLVLLCINLAVGVAGGAGVGFGIAVAGLAPGPRWQWSMVGGALGGLVVGAVAKLLGTDAFTLLFGQSPGDITGAAEGAILGGAVGLAAWFGSRGKGPGTGSGGLRRGVAFAGLAGGVAGLLIAALGGRLMGGSLDRLARQFAESRLSLDQIGALFGESEFGPVSLVVTTGLEGAVFGGCVVGAMMLARRAAAS